MTQVLSVILKVVLGGPLSNMKGLCFDGDVYDLYFLIVADVWHNLNVIVLLSYIKCNLN